jgi:hypothetical protein
MVNELAGSGSARDRAVAEVSRGMPPHLFHVGKKSFNLRNVHIEVPGNDGRGMWHGCSFQHGISDGLHDNLSGSVRRGRVRRHVEGKKQQGRCGRKKNLGTDPSSFLGKLGKMW